MKNKNLTDQLRENPWIVSTIALGSILFVVVIISMIESKKEIELELPGLDDICVEMTGEINWIQCSYCLTTFEGLNQSCFIINKD